MLRRWENTENQYWAWLHSLYLLAYREENIAPAFLLFSAHLSLGLPQCNVPRDTTWLDFTWYSNAAFQSYTNIEGEKCLQSNEVSQLSNFHLYLCFWRTCIQRHRQAQWRAVWVFQALGSFHPSICQSTLACVLSFWVDMATYKHAARKAFMSVYLTQYSKAETFYMLSSSDWYK